MKLSTKQYQIFSGHCVKARGATTLTLVAIPLTGLTVLFVTISALRQIIKRNETKSASSNAQRHQPTASAEVRRLRIIRTKCRKVCKFHFLVSRISSRKYSTSPKGIVQELYRSTWIESTCCNRRKI